MDEEHKLLVGLGSPEVRGGPTTVVLGMTPAGFEHMKDDYTHTVDLRKVGINVQIMIFRGDTHAEMASVIGSGLAEIGIPVHDMRGTGELPDLGIDEPTKQ